MTKLDKTAIPDDELQVFKSLKWVRTVFDVGARDDVDYLIVKPKIKLHCFEPSPIFFEQLKINANNHPNAYLNNFGCSDINGEVAYNDGKESMMASADRFVEVRRLDDYINIKKIKRIDFLKIDTEGHETKVINGLGDKIKICRYIQYEEGGDVGHIEKTMGQNGFKCYYIGGRNWICVRDGEEMPWIPLEPREGGLRAKSFYENRKFTL